MFTNDFEVDADFSAPQQIQHGLPHSSHIMIEYVLGRQSTREARDKFSRDTETERTPSWLGGRRACREASDLGTKFEANIYERP